MPTGLTELLKSTVARIEIGGQPNGTGFFVTPGLVVTCAHVLDPLTSTSAGARPSLCVVDGKGVEHPLAGAPRLASSSDLALLQLQAADTSVGVALLNDMFEVDDELYAFGFPEGKPEGDPASFVVEGLGGGPQSFIKMKDGQVRAGMSGAPLLNRRTGAVCGIIKKTRNEQLDIGGYGVRVNTLFSEFDELPRLNAAASRSDPTWMRQLTAEQRHLVQPSGPASPESTEYTELVVEVGHDGDYWSVEATEHPGGVVVPKVRVDLNVVRAEVPRLFRAWKAQGRIDDAEQARLLGHVLYRSIMPEAIGAKLEELTLQQKRPVHVSLCFGSGMDADLVHLPWEQLFVRGEGTVSASLAVAQKLTLTRVQHPGPVEPEPPSRKEATVLLATAPFPESPREVSQVYKLVTTDLRGMAGVSVAEGSGELKLEEIEDRLGAADADVAVLHYVGFGRYEDRLDQIALPTDEAEGVEFISADQLSPSLFQRPPTLVVLQTCADSGVPVPADPTAFAMDLMDAGVQAVVAFPFPLQVEDAELASRRLYEQLAAGSSIRLAVQDARRSLRRAPWARPALFMREPSDLRLVLPE